MQTRLMHGVFEFLQGPLHARKAGRSHKTHSCTECEARNADSMRKGIARSEGNPMVQRRPGAGGGQGMGAKCLKEVGASGCPRSEMERCGA